MSVDEDTELRDLVAQTLESNGVLGKIRAQLRSNIFLVLEEQENIKNKTPYVNGDLKKFVSTKEGRLITGLVREFLEHFKLDYTLAVFDPEACMKGSQESRDVLAREFDIIQSSSTSSLPLLAEVIKRGREVPSRSRLGSSTDKETSSKPKDSKDAFTKNDAFFDDPIPDNSQSTLSSSTTNLSEKPGGGGGLASLSDLPSLTGNNGKSPRSESTTPRMPETDAEDIKSISKQRKDSNDLDLGDYDEDFESSKSDNSFSGTGQTPRSAKSDQNVKSLENEVEEDIEEDIEEDFSVGEDLLKSDNSGMDDLTTDRTVSPTDQSNAFDYIEEVIS